MLDDSMLEDFLALSRILTGVIDLNAEIGRQYLERLEGSGLAPQVQSILKVFAGLTKDATLAKQVKAQIVWADALRPTVAQIVLLWYTSSLQDLTAPAAGPLVMQFGTQEEYFSGLAWKIMGAHVPGLSGGYFGHWHYRPDNEPSAAPAAGAKP
jgi:hypothetical protein